MTTVTGHVNHEPMGNCLERQRAYRRETGNASTKRYEKTQKGFLMRLYRNMQSRVTGIHKAKRHLYEGKEILPREEFYAWATDHPTFLALWKEWEENDRHRRLTPSVDRVDSSGGYTLDNMEWVPFHVNCSRGTKRRNQVHGNPNQPPSSAS